MSKASLLQFTARVFIAISAGTLPSHAEDQLDNSGTNPVVLSRSLGISNEYKFLSDDRYFDVATVKYTEPFADGRASLKVSLPVAATDIGAAHSPGLGDLSAKLSWIPYADARMGFVLSSEIGLPTAGETAFGSGKWTIAPGVVWANMVTPELIIAPALIHTVSFAGDDARGDINRSDFDLYIVYKPKGERWWVTGDLTASYDFENQKTPMSFEVSFGRNLAFLENGAAVNGYIRPGIGLGEDRPYDYNIEAGLTVVGF